MPGMCPGIFGGERNCGSGTGLAATTGGAVTTGEAAAVEATAGEAMAGEATAGEAMAGEAMAGATGSGRAGSSSGPGLTAGLAAFAGRRPAFTSSAGAGD